MVIRAEVPRRRALWSPRRALAVGVGIATLVGVVAVSGGASAASSGQHVWESGRVTGLADGDTIYVKVRHHTYSVRNLGIQATETSHGHGRNQCGAVAARHYLRTLTLHKRVQLASMHRSSSSLGRLLRTVYVGKSKNVNRDLDVQAAEMSRGLTLWHPDASDSAHNTYYLQLQELAQARHKRLWNPTFCGKGNDQGVPLKLWINSDANGSDVKHVNGEWVGVENMSTTQTANLSHWDIRDGSHVGDPAYRFPKHTRLRPGQVLKLHSGSGHSSVRTHNFYNWGDAKPRWNDNLSDGMGEGAYLQDRKQNIRASATYPCVVTAVTSCVDPLAKDLAWGHIEYAPGNDRADPNGEYLSIHNISQQPVDLSFRVIHKGGWVLTLKKGTILAPGQTLQIFSGKGHATALKQYFGDNHALLADAGGEVELRMPNYVQTMCVDWGDQHANGCTYANGANQ
jgi:endonuclease YncB( thermonuclease family)